MGNAEANLQLETGAKIKLLHPDGGTAYAISYKSQKIIESLQGAGERLPGAAFIGHFHKSEYIPYQGVHTFQTGTMCFRGSTGVRTAEGTKKIHSIKEGDLVLTHKNRFMPVIKIYKHKHKGNFWKINFGRKNSDASRIVGTPEHPIWVERNGTKQWIAMENVVKGDTLFVPSSECRNCKAKIPYYNVFCNDCNPMNMREVQEKLSKTRGPIIMEYNQSGTGWIHLKKDILPYCEKLEDDGYSVVPVGAGVIPDIIAFKDGKIHSFELESKQGLALERKKKKYENAQIMEYLDEVHWINLKEKKKQGHNYHEFDEESGFIKVKVLESKKEETVYNENTVYNLEVLEDNSYVASNVVVHNCNATKFMRGKGIPAHKGFWVIDLYSKKNGKIDKVVPQYYPAK